MEKCKAWLNHTCCWAEYDPRRCNGDKLNCHLVSAEITSVPKPKKRLYTAIFEARCGISVMAASEDEAEKIALNIANDKIWEELHENVLELVSIERYDK